MFCDPPGSNCADERTGAIIVDIAIDIHCNTMPSNRGDVLFELPIAATGNVVVTSPQDKVYLIAFISPPDNRLVTVPIT